jgi:hypothetical protein
VGAVTVKAARAALTDCEDSLEAAISAGSVLVDHEKEAATEIERAQEALDKAVTAVVKSEANVARLLKEAKAIQADLIARRVVLRFLYNGFLEERESELRTFLLFEQHLPVGRGQAEHGNYNAHPAADPWNAAVRALATNPAAPLPTE